MGHQQRIASERWRIPGFTELRELGAGAQGRAVLVREDASGRVAVAKYVVTAGDASAQTLFRRESVLLNRVHSPYVARWFGHFEDASGSAILMEAVNGVSLKTVLAEHHALAPEAALLVLKGSLLGLAAAHELGVVHRDYKPANVIVQADGVSKLIDFGVATIAGESSRSGTPAYMAPEQWQGEPASPSTDVYAATCVFFECVAGHKPYLADEVPALMAQHLTAPIPADGVPPETRELVVRGLAKEMSGRPESAAAFVAELEAAASTAYGDDWEERGAALLAGAAAAMTALFPLAILMVQGATAPAVGPTAIATGGSIGRSLLAKLGANKATVAVATGAATVGVAAVVATSIPKKPKPPQISVSFETEEQRYSDGTDAMSIPYAKVSGIGDPTLRSRINAALRAPADQWLHDYLAPSQARPTSAYGSTHSRATVRVTLQTPRLLSLSYAFAAPPALGNRVAVRPGGVTVDLATARILGPREVFRSDVLLALNRLLLTEPTPQRLCGGQPITPAEYVMTWSKLVGGNDAESRAVEISWTPDHVSFMLNMFPLGCTMAAGWQSVDVPYPRLRELLKPDIVRLLPAQQRH